MVLRISEVERNLPQSWISVQMIGDGLVLFEVVSIVPHGAGSVVHWRLANGRKPPLDIFVDDVNGRFLEVDFFVSGEKITRDPRSASIPRPVPITTGSPVFDLSVWEGTDRSNRGHFVDDLGRYFDEPGEASMRLMGNDLVLRFGEQEIAYILDAGVIQFMCNVNDYLIGLVLPHLDTNTIATLGAANVLV